MVSAGIISLILRYKWLARVFAYGSLILWSFVAFSFYNFFQESKNPKLISLSEIDSQKVESTVTLRGGKIACDQQFTTGSGSRVEIVAPYLDTNGNAVILLLGNSCSSDSTVSGQVDYLNPTLIKNLGSSFNTLKTKYKVTSNYLFNVGTPAQLSGYNQGIMNMSLVFDFLSVVSIILVEFASWGYNKKPF